MSALPAYPLRAERGGLAPDTLPDLPRPRMTPAEISLTLSADVLRLPYVPATRLVLAEIVSLYSVNGHCDASDAHFAARLTISTDTANRAVKELEADGLLVKVTTRVRTGLYRTLTPNSEAITAKAASNPYPQNAATNPQNAAREGSRKMPVAYPQNAESNPQNAATPTRILPVALPAKCGSNIPVNNTSTFQVIPDDAASAAALVEEVEVVAQVEKHKRQASHTEGGAADVGTSITKKRLLMRDSPLATLAAFAQAWQAAAEAHPETYAPYAQADLAHYHAALLGWSNAEGKTKFDWLSTIRNSMSNDVGKGLLRRLGKVTGAGQAPSQVESRLTTIDETLAARRARRQQST
jgi:hypothetical protein